MVIVTDFGCSVQLYEKCFEQLVFPRPAMCPHCQASGECIGHGYYVRKVQSKLKVYVIKIKRWYCKICRHTTSLLPSFVLSHRHYELSVIQEVLERRFEQAESWFEIMAAMPSEIPTQRTLRRWCQAFEEQAERWSAAIQQVLAEQDAVSVWLNPLGEVTEARSTPGALLQAAVHLLAWGKTHWQQVADYGLNDRLRFLWHWGAGRGLGRLL